MTDGAARLETVGEIVEDLRELGLMPVMVGGMALVVLGSQRVTRDVDFVIGAPDVRLREVVDVMYRNDLELVSRLNADGDVIATIDNRKVAAARLRIDAPKSAYFFNADTRLRIDLLFDFPIPAATLLEHATRLKIQGRVFDIASEDDLYRLKTIARGERSTSRDAEDLAFLEARRRRSP
jgi:hypothetical protein